MHVAIILQVVAINKELRLFSTADQPYNCQETMIVFATKSK